MFTASFLSTNLSLKCSPHHFQTDQYMPQCWVYWIPSHDIPIIVGRHPHFCWGISLVFDVHHSPNMDGYILMLGWFPAGFPFRHPHYGCLASPRNWRSSFCFYLYVCWWSPCKIFESPFRVDYIYIYQSPFTTLKNEAWCHIVGSKQVEVSIPILPIQKAGLPSKKLTQTLPNRGSTKLVATKNCSFSGSVSNNHRAYPLYILYIIICHLYISLLYYPISNIPLLSQLS